jgi:hypothetical protein
LAVSEAEEVPVVAQPALLLASSWATTDQYPDDATANIHDAYLLVDKILIIIFEIEFPLHLFNFGSLHEYLPFNGKYFLPRQLALAHQSDQLPSILQLLSQPP